MTPAAAKIRPRDSILHVDSDILGTISVPADRLARFPEGLLGFPDARDFVLVAAARDGAFWLQSTEHSSLVFLVVDPFLHFPDYAVDLSATDTALLDVGGHEDVAILVVVTLGDEEGSPCTANLQGPLALNLRRGLGRQVVLRNLDAGVRRELDLDGAA
jgi:flagellar assembly factor FliW